MQDLFGKGKRFFGAFPFGTMNFYHDWELPFKEKVGKKENTALGFEGSRGQGVEGVRYRRQR